MFLIKRKSNLSIRSQCEYLGISRSSYYHTPKGETKENLDIMRLMDEPTAGVLTMQSMLKDHLIHASYERVRRLMRKANILAIYPKKHLSVLGEKKYIYPYLLRNLDIVKTNQVWEIDITYISMKNGFIYITAIIDVFSRYMVGWGLSNSLDAGSSIRVVKEAVAIHGRPQILNSDQRCQFTCKEYIEYLKAEHIQISMDSMGRALDNIYIERFWRTIKYQYIYLNPENNGLELYKRIKKWIERYHNRDHQGINRMKPNIIYYNVA